MNASQLLSELDRVRFLLTEARLDEFALAAAQLEQTLTLEPPTLNESEAEAARQSGQRLGRVMQEAAGLTGALLALQLGPDGEAYSMNGAPADGPHRRIYGEV